MEKTFLENDAIWYAFYKQFAILNGFEINSSVISKKNNFVCFEKSYYFSRIIRQICYNLVKKFHVLNIV